MHLKNQFFLTFLAIFFLFNYSHQNQRILYYIDENYNIIDNSLYAEQQNDFDAVAIAEFQDSMYTVGWDYLKIKTMNKFPDIVQMRLAGYLEGYITYEQISNYYDNFVAFTFPQFIPFLSNQSYAYVSEQFDFIKSQINKNNQTSTFWQMANGVLNQLEGMHQGYQARIASESKKNSSQQYTNMSWFNFALMTAREDLDEVIQCYPPSNTTQTSNNKNNVSNIAQTQLGHCSAFIKIVNGKLYNTHATWNTLTDMLRIYKVYEFNLNNKDVVAKTITFSSYPAHVNSWDDFFVASTNLSIMGTSLGFNNLSLCNTLNSSSIPSWMRVNIANRFGFDGESWLQVFQTFFSGTHNNQWMVVDYNKFRQNSTSGILYVLENFFYLYKYFDATQSFLFNNDRGYFASFNAAINQEIQNVSFSTPNILFGKDYSAMDNYFTAFRYFIFKKYQPEAIDLDSIKTLMRNRTYLFTEDNPFQQISARIDLDKSCISSGGGLSCAWGAYDMKIIDDQMMINQQEVHLISSPPYDGFPAFEYTGLWSNLTHKGIPDKMEFDWQIYNTTIDFTTNARTAKHSSVVEKLILKRK